MRRSATARSIRIHAAIAVCILLLQLTACKRKAPVAAPAISALPVPSATAPVTPVSRAPRVAMTVESIDRALTRARGFLYASWRSGQWGSDDPENKNAGRDSSLVLRALLQGGEDAMQGRVSNSLKQQRQADPKSTQARAERLRVSVLLRPDEPTKRLVKLDASRLMASALSNDANTGFHTRADQDSRISLLASAQATIALAESMQRQIEVPTAYWHMSNNAWRAQLRKELLKGFTVGPGGLTADDLRPLLCNLDVLATIDDVLSAATSDPKASAPDKLFDMALTELEEHYTDLFHGPGEFEALETFARIMRSRGIRLFDGHDWYCDGVGLLLAVQKLDGSWGNGVRDTAHAMLFLSRARATLLFNKLQYAGDTHRAASIPAWNNRPNDLAHLTHWIGDQMEHPFDWQVLKIDAPIEDWFNAPILYISGNGLLTFSDEQLVKLKRYIEQGGLIVGNAESGDARFSTSFIKLGQSLFPKYEFRILPENHPLFNAMFPASKEIIMPRVQSMSNGVRELMLLLPNDPGRGWQVNQFLGTKATSGAHLAANIVSYATEKRFRFKEEFFPDQAIPNYILAGAGAPEVKRPPRPAVDLSDLMRDIAAATPAIPPKPDKSVTLAMITATADPQSLPAFDALRGAMRLKDTNLSIDPLVLGKWTLQRYDTATITAGQLAALGQLQRLELKRFIDTGGTLMIDASAKPENTLAVEKQIASLFTDPKLILDSQTPADSVLFPGITSALRIGRLDGRVAVVVNTQATQADAILEELLTLRAK